MDPSIAQTPEPPYTAVIFTSARTPGDHGYGPMSARMDQLAREQPGYLGHESTSEDGLGITVSYWTSHAAAAAWKLVSEHSLPRSADEPRGTRTTRSASRRSSASTACRGRRLTCPSTWYGWDRLVCRVRSAHRDRQFTDRRAAYRGTEFATRDFHDTWLPELAPSQDLVTRAPRARSLRARSLRAESHVEWSAFVRAYRKQMSGPAARHLLDLVAHMSHATSLAVGCYCEDENRCHRSVLRELLAERGAELGWADRGSGFETLAALAPQPP